LLDGAAEILIEFCLIFKSYSKCKNVFIWWWFHNKSYSYSW